MYKHSTTHRTLSRRLAALLAVLALLAALALPVYAEALNGAAQMQETVEMDNNGETDNKVETGSDVEPDDKSKTNEPTTPAGKEAAEDSTANADGNNASENEDTKDNASSSTTGDSNTTAGDAANDTPQTPPDDNIDPTASKTTMDDTPDTMDEAAKQNIVTQSTDDAETADDEATDNEIAAYSVTYPVWVYVAVGDNFPEGWKVRFNSNKVKDGSDWLEKQPMVEQKTLYKGRKVFGFELTQENCPNNGYSRIQFLSWNSDGQKDPTYEASNKWMDIEDFANKLYDAQTGKWENGYKPFDPTDHTAFSGKKMAFKNASNDTLTNVVAHFYEKNEDGSFTEVETQNLNNKVSAGAKEEFKIPTEKPCGFVQFTAGDGESANKISSLYNFYGQTGDEESFLYNEETQFCFVYNTNSMAHWGTGEGQRTIYYDATFSKLSADTGFAIPSNVGGTVYYYLTGKGIADKAGEMARQTNDLYSVDIKDGYDHIIFGAYKPTSATNVAGKGNSTANLEIPDEYTSPCFYADTGDDSTYGGSGGTRGGYWAEVKTLRNAEANKAGKTVVDVPKAEFKADSSTKYIDTTLYDYYSDWELNGNNRDDYAQFNTWDGQGNTFANNDNANRNWVTFRQFDQALSDYYQDSTKTVLYPMYTGQFQPDATGNDGEWGFRFSGIADKLKLYGYSDDKNKFMAVNNSTIDVSGGGLGATQDKYYDDAFQGLTGDNLVDGEPVMYNTKLTVPYFNKDFLLKSNSKNAKLGEVYDNVSFPFTKKTGLFKDANEEQVEYWYFDSNDTTLYLKQDTGKQDTGNNGYFLQKQENDKRTGSRNLKANSYYQDKETFGFFPFNEHSANRQASTYNYGFGAKLKFQFTMNEDGKVYGTDGETKVPIKFFFSGDDDVWVYIDDELALDVGGDHGKVSGLLEFGLNTKNELVYTPYVSDVKASNAARMYTKDSNCKSVKYLGDTKTFNYKGKEKSITPGTHTLTMFYMERGMWESNMAIAFNFPDHNELEVEKQVKVDGVNELFKKYFQNADLFGFTIKNLATHYGKQSASELLETKELKVDKASWTAKPANKSQCEWEQTELGNISSTDAIHWFAGMTDANSDYRPQRYGVITPNSVTADISEMGYLTFKVYANTEIDDYLKLNDLYLELEDSSGYKWGSLNKAGLAGKTYNGISKLTKKNWVTVKIDLSKLTKEEDFDAAKLKTIYIGDNRPVNLYIKDIQFTSKAEVKALAGFRTAQKDIPDYETAIGNTDNVMKPAVGAQYTSNRGGSTQVVDEEGRFQLRDKEVITFKDQFRRGSYISVTEDADPDLYETKWTIYENGQAVTTNNGGNTVSKGTLPLSNVKSNAPDDGRVEKKSSDIPLADDTYGNSYSGAKPKGEAIVFRSYSNPDANDTAELTKLRLQFVNTVKTGSIIIQKEGDNTVTSGKFQFKVTYTNVGGQNLEGENTIEETYDVTYDVPYEIKGIPIGTQFTIEEIESDGTYLQKVEVAKGDSAQVIKGKTVEGTVTKLESDSASVTATFTNTKHQLMDIDLVKNWQNASGQPMTADELETVPDTIYVKLQRRIVATLANPWTDVKYPSGSTLEYVEIKRDNGGWHYKFANLDATQWDSTEETKPQYEYRVVEGKLEDGSFTPMGDDETTIVLDGKVYKVSGGTETTTDDGKHTITLTNKLQDPEFNLDVIKKSAEDDTFLDGVEFTLEKMNDDGTAVDMSFDMRTGVTNSKGEIKAKNADGTAGDANIFHGLKAGIYRLTETKTKAGYSLLSEPIEIKFTQQGGCQLNGAAADSNIFKPNPDGSYTLTLTVLNRKTPTLPHTGADAPSLWLLIGLPLAVAGLLILVFRYNKKGGRTR